MNATTLQQFLAQVIAAELAKSPVAKGVLPVLPVSRGASNLSERASQIAEELIKEAIASGLPLTCTSVDKVALKGGNTAEIVAQLTLHAPFAFKLDREKVKLAKEGKAMRSIKNNMDLPQHFRDAWPVIYAVRDIEPYAYLMEFFPEDEGWVSLEDRLYPINQDHAVTSDQAIRHMHTVLDILFEGFTGSVNKRNNPSLMEDYYSRIKERLEETSKKDDRFASAPLIVNGEHLKPWAQYLQVIERSEAYRALIACKFSTVVHGDPNPGNLMLRTNSTGEELKLIDPKEWEAGDYLFDICKITHFLECTGPVEKPISGEALRAEFSRNNGAATLSYDICAPDWTTALVAACRERVKEFAESNGDRYWLERYELGMAANLLGLPLARLSNGREHSALILYGEGLKWLHRFCERLEFKIATPAKALVSTKPNEIEPEPLRDVRDWVRRHVPGVLDNVDRRGFQLLQWDPLRPNDEGKLAELSLEHEARLYPATNEALKLLLQDLHRSDKGRMDEHLLPGNKEFGSLVVSRYNRDIGPQSVDHYYDVSTPSGGPTLIPRMMTVRKRVRGREFMTWSSDNDSMHPLNLELPFINLDERGMTARLEFNWVDDLSVCLAEAISIEVKEEVQFRNPLCIAARTQSFVLDGLTAVLEHTTYREKFSFQKPTLNDLPGEQIFALNVDHVTAQDLKTRRIGTYTDVDISAVRPIDKNELASLVAFVDALRSRYDLRPNFCTKAWRDADVTGLLVQ